ncbi:chemotaxis protein methyltransferase CheR [Alteribacillus persepolensis]|uniref:protein-glutamate O-methyltransferase n=1 Tax=Alteribacillus persepolensis TaxID=568899 RepID=A0A1G7ZGE1_9BACI|nr:protein-glutamate O-methyltransferase CheR [Alteribacillus persepolensis]SDH07657.1 chemotaxis protein methyltransferase CheR [Alteribacillus persepolensis]
MPAHSMGSPGERYNQDYSDFVRNVKKKTGIDLSLYKEAQMKRRLRSFFEKNGYHTFEDFFHRGLNQDGALLSEFLERMTINVSEFYRNPKRWDVLTTVILPRLKKERSRLNVWSAACSTGEEPYTLAIILDTLLKKRQYSILATDIDETVLAQAEQGLYSDRALKELSSHTLSRYFDQNGTYYKVKPFLQGQVTFRKHNLLNKAVQTGFDLIVCRNVLIYFTEAAKHDIYKEFNKALTVGGVLFVGSTEQIFTPSRYGFETEDTFFYKKVKDVT